MRPSQLLQLRIVQAGVPGVEAQRLAVARVDDQFVVAHRVVGSGAFAGSCQLRRRTSAGLRLNTSSDVAALAVAQFDADRVGQDQPVELVAAGDRDLGRQPAAERQPDQRDLARNGSSSISAR